VTDGVTSAARDGDTRWWRRAQGPLFEILETLVLTVLIFVAIQTFVAQPYEVKQTSMQRTLSENQYVLVDKLTPRWQPYARGDIVVFEPPEAWESEGVPLIKRVIGLPGDTVELVDGHVEVNGIELDEPYVFQVRGEPQPTEPGFNGTTQWLVPDGELLVFGDHRGASADSREFGPVEVSRIVGRAWLRYWPFDVFGVLGRPEYPELAP
jgi:signal peptidase I